MITDEEKARYVLFLREEEMNNNYELSKEQIELIKKIETARKGNDILNEELNKLLQTKSMFNMNKILQGDDIEQEARENIVSIPINDEIDDVIEEKGKQYTLVNNKKAGFVDVLVMALTTGFIGGVAATILLILCK